MIIKNPITGEYIKQTLTDEGVVVTKPSEQELNAYLKKPTFTSVPTKPLIEDDDDDDDASFSKDLARIGFGFVEGIAELGSDVFIRPFVEDKKEYDESYIEWRGDMAVMVTTPFGFTSEGFGEVPQQLFGPKLDREDIIDVETGKVLRPEPG